MPYDVGYRSEKAIFAYNTETGNVIWKYQTQDIPAYLIISEGKLYAGFTSEDVVRTQIIGFGK
jgi:outer membrane protein assembly factor BamB